MPVVYFAGAEIECEEGAVLRDVLMAAGRPPHNDAAEYANCGGNAICGTCAVKVDGDVSGPTAREQARTSLPPHRGSDIRLACQVRVEGDVTVRKPPGLWGHQSEEEPTEPRTEPPAPTDWPTYRATPGNTAATPAANGRLFADAQWESDTSGRVTGSPIPAADDLVFATADDGSVHAFERGGGDRRWRSDLGTDYDDGAVPSPVVADGSVFVGGSVLTSFEATTGAWRWEAPVPEGRVSATPAVLGNLLFVPTDDGVLRTIDTVTGLERWTLEIDDPIARTTGAPKPAPDDGTVYFSSDHGVVVAADAVSGDRLWQASLSPVRGHPGAPAVVPRAVLVRAGRELHALDVESGARSWTFDPGSSVVTPPAVDDQQVLVGTADGALVSVDGTKEEQWRADVGAEVVGGPAIADGTAYVATADGRVHAVDTGTGSHGWSHDVVGRVCGGPSVDGESLYVATDYASLHALG